MRSLRVHLAEEWMVKRMPSACNRYGHSACCTLLKVGALVLTAGTPTLSLWLPAWLSAQVLHDLHAGHAG